MAGGATAWAALDSEAQQKLVAEAVAALDEEAALNRCVGRVCVVVHLLARPPSPSLCRTVCDMGLLLSL